MVESWEYDVEEMLSAEGKSDIVSKDENCHHIRKLSFDKENKRNNKSPQNSGGRHVCSIPGLDNLGKKQIGILPCLK